MTHDGSSNNGGAGRWERLLEMDPDTDAKRALGQYFRDTLSRERVPIERIAQEFIGPIQWHLIAYGENLFDEENGRLYMEWARENA